MLRDLENIDRVHLTILVPSSHVLVDVGRLLAPILAVWTLEPRLLTALVSQMSIQRVFLAVGTGTIRTRELLLIVIVYIGLTRRSGP